MNKKRLNELIKKRILKFDREELNYFSKETLTLLLILITYTTYRKGISKNTLTKILNWKIDKYTIYSNLIENLKEYDLVMDFEGNVYRFLGIKEFSLLDNDKTYNTAKVFDIKENKVRGTVSLLSKIDAFHFSKDVSKKYRNKLNNLAYGLRQNGFCYKDMKFYVGNLYVFNDSYAEFLLSTKKLLD